MQVCTSQSLIDALSCSYSVAEQIISEHQDLLVAPADNVTSHDKNSNTKVVKLALKDVITAPGEEDKHKPYPTSSSSSSLASSLNSLALDAISANCSSMNSNSSESSSESSAKIMHMVPQDETKSSDTTFMSNEWHLTLPCISSTSSNTTNLSPPCPSCTHEQESQSQLSSIHRINHKGNHSTVLLHMDQQLDLLHRVPKNATASVAKLTTTPRKNQSHGRILTPQHISKIKRHAAYRIDNSNMDTSTDTNHAENHCLSKKLPMSPSSVLKFNDDQHPAIVSPQQQTFFSKSSMNGISSSGIRKKIKPSTYIPPSYHLKMKYFKTMSLLPPTIEENHVLQDSVLQSSPQRAFLSCSLMDLSESRSDDTSSTISS